MKDTLLVTELFFSLQGEGHFVGTPSIFIRLHGCNFTCQGFGQSRDKSKWKPEDEMLHRRRDLLIQAKEVSDLPVPAIGCDSSLSWSKYTKHLATEYTPEALAETVFTLLDSTTKGNTISSINDVHLVITGGEPLILNNQTLLTEFLEAYKVKCDINSAIKSNIVPLKNITFETNGSYPIQTNFSMYFNTNLPDVKVTFSVSPKLSVSGEKESRALKPFEVSTYSHIKNSFVYLKFVVRDEQCLTDVRHFIKTYEEAGAKFEETYLMPEGGTVEGLSMNEVNVAEFCIQHGFKFSPRLHMNLWKNAWGT